MGMCSAKEILGCASSKRRETKEMRELPFREASHELRLGAKLAQSETRLRCV